MTDRNRGTLAARLDRAVRRGDITEDEAAAAFFEVTGIEVDWPQQVAA